MDKTNPNDRIRKRYNRIAFLYDFLEAPMECLRFAGWRKRLRTKIKGERALEVGVRTGKNLAYYPANVHITAIDFSLQMLARASQKVKKPHLQVNPQQMDVHHLEFLDNEFDRLSI